MLVVTITGGESIQLTFKYHEGVTQKNRNIICFAWCNNEMKKSPPTRPTIPPTTTLAPTTTTQRNWKEEIVSRVSLSNYCPPQLVKCSRRCLGRFQLPNGGRGSQHRDHACVQDFPVPGDSAHHFLRLRLLHHHPRLPLLPEGLQLQVQLPVHHSRRPDLRHLQCGRPTLVGSK